MLPESLNRLLRSGIDPALSAEQTRHIMAVNTGAMLGVAATLPFVGLGVWLDNPLMSVLNLMHLVLWLPSVALNRWGWHRLAATTLLGTATLEFAIQPLLWGIESGAQYALMIPAFVAWSMYDRHNTRWAAAMSGLATLLFLIHLNLLVHLELFLILHHLIHLLLLLMCVTGRVQYGQHGGALPRGQRWQPLLMLHKPPRLRWRRVLVVHDDVRRSQVLGPCDEVLYLCLPAWRCVVQSGVFCPLVGELVSPPFRHIIVLQSAFI